MNEIFEWAKENPFLTLIIIGGLCSFILKALQIVFMKKAPDDDEDGWGFWGWFGW